MGLHIEGMPDLVRRIKTLEQLRGLRGIMLAIGAHVVRKLRVYPSPSHRPQPFKSDRSRRYFFYALANGLIQVPYTRSTQLQDSWSASALSDTAVEIGTNLDYAPLVQGEGTQTEYHRLSGWKTEAQVLAEEEETISAYAIYGLQNLVDQV